MKYVIKEFVINLFLWKAHTLKRNPDWTRTLLENKNISPIFYLPQKTLLFSSSASGCRLVYIRFDRSDKTHPHQFFYMCVSYIVHSHIHNYIDIFYTYIYTFTNPHSTKYKYITIIMGIENQSLWFIVYWNNCILFL